MSSSEVDTPSTTSYALEQASLPDYNGNFTVPETRKRPHPESYERSKRLYQEATAQASQHTGILRDQNADNDSPHSGIPRNTQDVQFDRVPSYTQSPPDASAPQRTFPGDVLSHPDFPPFQSLRPTAFIDFMTPNIQSLHPTEFTDFMSGPIQSLQPASFMEFLHPSSSTPVAFWPGTESVLPSSTPNEPAGSLDNLSMS